VDVQVREQAGELRVAVRTPDPQLTETLRAELPQLASKLTESGYQARIWNPGNPLSQALEGARETAPARATAESAAGGRDAFARGESGQEERSHRWSELWEDGPGFGTDRKNRRNRG
jgi:hypothetical protein